MGKAISSEGKKVKALIVANDHLAYHLPLQKQLIFFGFEVAVYSDTDQGWKFFEKELPPLVFLDTDLHERPWTRFCQKIREHPSGRYVTVLLTGSSPKPSLWKGATDEEVYYYLDLEGNPDALPGWVAAARERVKDLRELKLSHEKVATYEKEFHYLNTQLEEALTRANQLAVEAELAYLELDQIFKTAAGGILVVDAESNVLRYNEAFLATTRLTHEKMRNRKCYEAFELELCQTPDCPVKQILKGRRRVENEAERQLVDGTTVHYMITSTPLRGPEADLIAIVINIIDITERVKAEKALRQSEEQFRLVVERAPFGQIILGKNNTFEYLNPKFSEVFGYTLQDIPDKSAWLEMAYPDESYRRSVIMAMSSQKAISDGMVKNGERLFTVTCKNGLEKIAAIKEADLGTGRKVITYVDETDRVKAEEALRESQRKYRELSIIDDLTRLYNKRHFNDILKAEISRTGRYRRPLSLLLMDIDNFKHYNDTYGHTKGDQVLGTVGEIVRNSIRQTDSGYRYGGEEFVVILPETSGEAAVSVAERIRTKLEAVTFCPVPEQKVTKTVSIGVAQYRPGEEEKGFIARADQNMYLAKGAGKNRVFFS